MRRRPKFCPECLVEFVLAEPRYPRGGRDYHQGCLPLEVEHPLIDPLAQPKGPTVEDLLS